MFKVPLEEQETIIIFNEADSTANVYTHSKKWIKHIESGLGVRAWRVQGQARDYEIPKKWLRLPKKPREATPAQKKHLESIRRVKALV